MENNKNKRDNLFFNNHFKKYIYFFQQISLIIIIMTIKFANINILKLLN